MLSIIKELYVSSKDKFNKLKTEQKYGITAIGGIIITLSTISYYLSYKKRKKWESIQSPELKKYWSKTYDEARTKFRSIGSKILNSKMHSIRVDPLDDLTVDLCYIPSLNCDNKHLCIHISGTHGVEGFAGSAIQIKLLQQIYNNNNNNQCNILFIHSLNAFGMKNGRRFNRFNVDLNRNAILNKSKWKKIKNRDPNIVGYKHVSSTINPIKIPNYPFDDILLIFKFIKEIIKFGSISSVGKAIVTGQYHNALGLFYGGFKLQNETKKVFNFIINECFNIWNIDIISSINKLTVIDVHTGLGPKGIDTILSPKSIYISRMKNISNFPNEYLTNPKRMQSRTNISGNLSKMYEFQTGDVRSGIFKLIYNKNRFINDDSFEYDSDSDYENKSDNKLDSICITQEFGTYHGFWVLHALINENVVYNKNLMDEKSQNILKFRQNKLKNVFYLHNDIKWKYNVLNRGVNLFNILSNR